MFKLVNVCYVDILVVSTKDVENDFDVVSCNSSSISRNVGLTVGRSVGLSVGLSTMSFIAALFCW